MPTQKKMDQVKNLTEKLAKAKVVVLADYTGLTHKQLESLRQVLKKTEAQLLVTKNTLLKRALEQVKKTFSSNVLQGAIATLLAYEDEVSPLKELLKFFKDATRGTVRAGFLGSQELTVAEVEKLATLPSHQQLLAQLVVGLQAPVYGLHNALAWNLRKLVWTLEAVKSKKQ